MTTQNSNPYICPDCGSNTYVTLEDSKRTYYKCDNDTGQCTWKLIVRKTTTIKPEGGLL